jgi:hypothetical protein
MIYKVTIEETVCDEFEIEANSEQEAFDLATEKYNCGEFVLEPGNLVIKQMLISDVKGNQITDWEEF